MGSTSMAKGWILGLLASGLSLLGRAEPGVGSWHEGRGFRYREVQPGPGAGRVGFTAIPAAAAGIGFTNVLQGDAFLTNFVAHNGSGVALGDVDGDGRTDIYFCGLESANRLYRNLGEWRFEEMDAGPAACSGQFSTGATFADVDGDGDLDLLVNGIAAGTRLFLNDGHGRLAESADSGLSKTASGTTLALADIEGDGDLDLYSAHYIDVMHLADPTIRFALAKRETGWVVLKVNGEVATLPRWKNRFEALPDGSVRELPEVHGLYRNEGGGRFVAIQSEPGRFLDEDGKPMGPPRDWGLAAMFRDFDGDGDPDLYVCNDNASPDRIWINTGKGIFRAIPRLAIRHISRSAMAVDFADINRDGIDDFLVTDMLARDPARRLRQLMRERPSAAEIERWDTRPAFNRNTLFLGRGDGTFAEVAWMAGVAATDWSWCPAFLDVDLDGYEDLLVTNGFDMDVMDQDSNDQMGAKMRSMTVEQRKRAKRLHPSFHTRNAAFRNHGDGTFEPAEGGWGFGQEGVSHGMALGDLDGDGDLDVVVNHLNQAPGLYRNEAAAGRVSVRLRGAGANTAGIGARIAWSGAAGAVRQTQEMICGGRYLSGDGGVRVFAQDSKGADGRIEVRWRSGKSTVVEGVRAGRCYEIREEGGIPVPMASNEVSKAASEPWFRDATNGVVYRHVAVPTDEWARQPLLPRPLDRFGPGVAWMDWDGDGWDDLVMGAGAGGVPGFWHGEKGHRFAAVPGVPPARGNQGAAVGWSDGGGKRHVLMTESRSDSGANEPGSLARYAAGSWDKPDMIPLGKGVPGPLAVADLDGDGDLDVFVGGRFVSGSYPEPADSWLLRNDAGRLVLDAEAGAPLRGLGLVTGAVFGDFDDDGRPDLVVATEWGPVRILVNRGGKLVDHTSEWGLLAESGLWTSVATGDFDGDGRLDWVAGNWGRNSPHELGAPGPWRIYHGDWDGNGATEVVEATRRGDRWCPVRSRSGLAPGFPDLALRLPSHEAFSQATIAEVIGRPDGELKFAEAKTLESAVFLNRGGRFERRALPAMAQHAPACGVAVGDADADGIADIFLAQNFLGANSDISREDGGRGLWLRGMGDGTFAPLDAAASGVEIHGEQRGAALADFDHDGRLDLAISQWNGETRCYRNMAPRRGWRVCVDGSRQNPDAIGARVRVVYADDRRGPLYEVTAGSGSGSQNSPCLVVGSGTGARALWIRWPGGREETIPVTAGSWEVHARAP